MVRYTIDEYNKMLDIYHRVGRNATEASKQYALENPHTSRKPGRKNFLRLAKRIWRTGSVKVFSNLYHQFLYFLLRKKKSLNRILSTFFERSIVLWLDEKELHELLKTPTELYKK